MRGKAFVVVRILGPIFGDLVMNARFYRIRILCLWIPGNKYWADARAQEMVWTTRAKGAEFPCPFRVDKGQRVFMVGVMGNDSSVR